MACDSIMYMIYMIYPEIYILEIVTYFFDIVFVYSENMTTFHDGLEFLMI